MMMNPSALALPICSRLRLRCKTIRIRGATDEGSADRRVWLHFTGFAVAKAERARVAGSSCADVLYCARHLRQRPQRYCRDGKINQGRRGRLPDEIAAATR